MNYSSRRDRLAAEKQALRSRRRRSLTVGTLGLTTASRHPPGRRCPGIRQRGLPAGGHVPGLELPGETLGSFPPPHPPLHASATSTASSVDYSTSSAGACSSTGEATYQLASYTTSASGSGWQADAAQWAKATANNPSVSYAFGGNGPTAYDCSGFTQKAFAQAGVKIPRTSSAQFSGANQYVGLSKLKVGDLVFWSNNGSASGIYHVAMYIGNGKIAHARNPSMGVSITDVDYSPWNMLGTAARYLIGPGFRARPAALPDRIIHDVGPRRFALRGRRRPGTRLDRTGSGPAQGIVGDGVDQAGRRAGRAVVDVECG